MDFEEYRSRESERIQANRKRMEEDGVVFQDIYNAYIDDSVVIEEGAFIACNVTLKGNTVIHREAFIGQSSYLENAEIGAGTKVQTSYILDSKVGENTTVGDDSFIGCNSNLVAPVNVGDGVYVAAATTITEDVPSDALCIGRVRAENKEGWVSKRKILKQDQ